MSKPATLVILAVSIFLAVTMTAGAEETVTVVATPDTGPDGSTATATAASDGGGDVSAGGTPSGSGGGGGSDSSSAVFAVVGAPDAAGDWKPGEPESADSNARLGRLYASGRLLTEKDLATLGIEGDAAKGSGVGDAFSALSTGEQQYLKTCCKRVLLSPKAANEDVVAVCGMIAKL